MNGHGLVYLMGPSGSGKDTVLRLLRERQPAHRPLLVAHRYITRPGGADEASLHLPPDEFDRRAGLGCFALHWHSHGLRYGIGVEIDTWLAIGATVVINGSRAHLAQAHARYPGLTAVSLQVDAAVLRARLVGRGREDAAQIAERLARASADYPIPAGCRHVVILNNSAPQHAADALLRALESDCAE